MERDTSSMTLTNIELQELTSEFNSGIEKFKIATKAIPDKNKDFLVVFRFSTSFLRVLISELMLLID